MKTTHVKVGKRTFALAFTVDAMADMQETMEDFDLSTLSERARTPRGLIDMLAIMAKHGELLEGRTLDVDRSWFGSHVSPAPRQIVQVKIAVLTALAKGLQMETEQDNDDEHDEVLEELKKKEPTDG